MASRPLPCRPTPALATSLPLSCSASPVAVVSLPCCLRPALRCVAGGDAATAQLSPFPPSPGRLSVVVKTALPMSPPPHPSALARWQVGHCYVAPHLPLPPHPPLSCSASPVAVVSLPCCLRPALRCFAGGDAATAELSHFPPSPGRLSVVVKTALPMSPTPHPSGPAGWQVGHCYVAPHLPLLPCHLFRHVAPAPPLEA